VPGARTPSRFVGRRPQRARLRRALAALARSHQQFVEVSGDPGLGKTRLLAELRELATRRGIPVAWSRASEQGRAIPFGLFSEHLADRVGRLDAGGIADLVATAARRGGLVLVLDDLHWADAGSVDVVAELLRHPREAPLLLAVAYRPRQLPSAYRGALWTAAGVAHHPVPLAPLSVAEAEELLGPMPRGRLIELYEAGGGNPGYLETLAGPADDEGESADGGPVPRALSGELATLAPAGLLAVRAAAVVGARFDLPLLAAAADAGVAGIAAEVDELMARDLVRTDESGFSFRHPLVAAAAYRTAPVGWRVAAHARVDRELASRGAPVSTRARHVERAARPGDQDAIAVLVDAADAAGPTDPDAAARLLGAAVRLLPHTPGPSPRRVDLMIARARSLHAAGHAQPSRDVLHEALPALSTTPSERRLRAVRLCAVVEETVGHHDEARALLMAELARCRDHGLAPSTGVAGITTELASNSARRVGSEADAWRWATEALAAMETGHGRTGDEIRARAALAVAGIALDRAERGRDEYRRAAAGLDDLPDAELAGDLCVAVDVARAGLALGHDGPAFRHARRGLAVARRGNRLDRVPELYLCSATAASYLGQLADAHADAAELDAVARRLGRTEFLAEAAGLRAEVGPEVGPGDGGLTDREREIAELASLGHPNRHIADQLFLSPRTVENHMSHILTKLGIGSRAALAGRLARLEATADSR
jgi:DNA-binding CsgD family transcriptional regulator